jgi:hypothetical protein
MKMVDVDGGVRKGKNFHESEESWYLYLAPAKCFSDALILIFRHDTAFCLSHRPCKAHVVGAFSFKALYTRPTRS